jgi:hypothetical protein
MLSRDIYMPTSFDISLRFRKKNKSAGAISGKWSGQQIIFTLRRLLESWTEAAVWTCELSLYLNQSWDDNADLFGVKIARAFLKHPTLSVLPLDFLNYGGDRNHDVTIHFAF